jgi:predicted SPOUT superfamily RNA methylase MTH1
VLYIGQKEALKDTEDIEKDFFANPEMLRKKGFESADQLALAVSAPQLTNEDATKYVRGHLRARASTRMTTQARLGRLSTEAKYIDMEKALSMRPDEVLTRG